MRRGIRGLAAVMTAAVLLTTGCASKEKYEYREAAIRQMEAGDYAAAVDSLNLALEKSDGTVGKFELDVLKYRAEAEFCLEDYEAAADTYDVLWQTDGQKPEYLTRCCVALIRSGQLETAGKKYRELYHTQPESEDTLAILLALGQAYRENGQQSEAVELFQMAADDGVQSGEIYNQLALNEIEFEEYDQALAFIEKGLAIGDGAREKLLFNQAVAYEKKLDFVKALQILETYSAEFGLTDPVEKEITFLKTRTD